MYDLSIRDMTIEEMKLWIMLFTGWEESILNVLTDDQIKQVYKERVERRNG